MRNVQDAASAVALRRDEVGVLDEAAKGNRGVADVHPVDRRELAAQRQHRTENGGMLEALAVPAIVRGKIGGQSRQQGRRDRRDHPGIALSAARGFDLEAPAGFVGRDRRDAHDRLRRVHRSALLGDRLSQAARHDPEATVDVSEALLVSTLRSGGAAQAHLVPDPRHRDRFGVAPELGAQQRPPHRVVYLGARIATEPLRGRHALERLAVRVPLQEQRDDAEADLRGEAEGAKAQQIHRRSEPIDSAATEHSHDRGDPAQALLQTELAEQAEHVDVGGEPMMIVLLDLGVAERERHRQATELSAAFEERYAHSRAGEPICRSQTGEAAADYRDMWRGDVSHFSHSSPPPTFLSSRNARARARRVANQPRGH